MKKALSLLVALAMLLSLATVAFAADGNVIAEETVTFTDADAWMGAIHSFTATADGTVSVEVTAFDSGYYVELWNDTNGEMAEGGGNYNVAGTCDFSVVSGMSYTLTLKHVTYYNANLAVASAGSITYKVTSDVVSSSTGGDSGDEEVADTTLELGDNAVALAWGDTDGETLTYTATEDGTLTVAVTAMSTWNDQTLSYDEVPAEYLGMQFMRGNTFTVNGVAGSYEDPATITVDVKTGDVVTVVLANSMGNPAKITLNLSMGSGEMTAEEILDAAYALEDGAALEGTYTLTGVITSIDSAYSLTYENITVTMVVDGLTEMPIQCYALDVGAATTEEDVMELCLGDTITVSGTIKNYKGTVEFDKGCTLDAVVDGEHSVPDTTEGLLTAINGLGADETLPYTVILSGTVTGIKTAYSSQYKNVSFYIDIDGTEQNILCYRMKGTDAETVAVGDHVKVAGLVVNYKGNTLEFNAGTFVLAPVEEETDNVLGSATDVAVGETEKIEIEFTPETDGVLTVVISGNPGWELKVTDTATDASVGLPASGATEATMTYELEAGVTYKITMNGYSRVDWGQAAATLTYDISFEPKEAETVVEEFVVSDTALVVGDNNVTLAENAETTLYSFDPTETGIYTVTVNGTALELSQWGSATYTKDTVAGADGLTVTCTAVGQSFLIGLSGDADSAVITITKSSDAEEHVETVYVDYVNVHTPDDAFELTLGEGDELVNVDITKAQTVVLGEDGYYHLGTADGPVLYVDLESDLFSLSAAYSGYGALTMRGAYTDADGVVHYYDFLNAMREYASASDANGMYPLTVDLAIYLQAYGAYQGWYLEGLSVFDAINDGTANAGSAWLALCSYVESAEEAPEESPETSDMSVLFPAVLMALTSLSGIVVVAKKKED